MSLGAGFLSQSSLEVYFGLGSSTGPLRATVTWPSGFIQTLDGLPADHRIVVVEGDAGFQATPFEPRNHDLSPCAPQQPFHPGVKAEGYPLLDPVPAPAFALKNLKGATVNSASFRGRPLLLNFWATWCKPCQEEMRAWVEHYPEILASGAAIAAISVDEPDQRAAVARFVAERRLPFTVLLADADTVRRFDVFYRGLFQRSTALQVPTSFLLDSGGNVVKLYRGPVPLETLRADLRQASQHPETFAGGAFPYPGRVALLGYARNFQRFGMKFIDRGFYADAEPYFRKAIERYPDDYMSWNLLGMIYGQQGDPERARQAFERSVALKPDFVPVNYNLAMLYLELRQPDRAEAAFARAYQGDPTDVTVLREYWKLLVAEDKVEDAKRILRAYLKQEPSDAEALNALGVTYARTGYPLLARESFARAVELQPGFAEAQKNLGTALVQTGELAAAVPVLERAVALKADDADALYMLAYAYAQTGRTADAEQALQKVLQLRPGDARARRALDNLHSPGAGRQP